MCNIILVVTLAFMLITLDVNFKALNVLQYLKHLESGFESHSGLYMIISDFSGFLLFCIGRGLATGQSLVHEVLTDI